MKEKREANGLSLRDTSSLLGIHHSIIGKIETGERKIDTIEFAMQRLVLTCLYVVAYI